MNYSNESIAKAFVNQMALNSLFLSNKIGGTKINLLVDRTLVFIKNSLCGFWHLLQKKKNGVNIAIISP